MAAVIKTTDEKKMVDEELPPEETPRSKGDPKPAEGGPVEYARKGAAVTSPGFFTVYKKGQGYWTRVGTVIAAVVVGAFTAYNLYTFVPTFLPEPRIPAGSTADQRGAIIAHGRVVDLRIAAAVVAAFVLGYALLCWRLLNKPTNADFLIATDSEMKKVNWTSRKELVGSTRIVILFMFIVALFLFGVDQIFGWLMYAAHVLKISPMGT